MKNKISYDDAYDILNKYLNTKPLILHSLESYIIMKKLAAHFGEDQNLWGITGLLHDLDLNVISGDYSKHGYKSVEILKEEGYDIPVMFDAILAHTEALEGSKEKRKTTLDFVLAGTENLTGLISAYVAVRPGKIIKGAKPKSLTKKFKDKSFSAAVNRQFINDVTEKTGLERSKYFQMGIEAMSEIADELGM